MFSENGVLSAIPVAATKILEVQRFVLSAIPVVATKILEVQRSALSVSIEEFELHILLEVLKHYLFVIPSGIIDGANTVFMFPFLIDSTKLEVVVNGLSLKPGSWSVVGGIQLTIVSPLLYPGDMLWVYYWDNPP